MLFRSIMFSVANVSVASALRLMLKEIGLTFVVRDEVLLITTIEEAEYFLLNRVYPVADLVSHGDYTELLDLIKKTTALPKPGWCVDGGVGTVEPFSDSQVLVVSQTDEVHEQIEALLTTLRRARRMQGLSSSDLAFAPDVLNDHRESAPLPRRPLRPQRFVEPTNASWQVPVLHQ